MVHLTEEMVLRRTKATDLENVKKLNCWASELTDVSVVRKMPNIQILSLSVNHITSLEDFAHCPCLEELYIRKNSVTDLSEVRHLEGLSGLRNLWLAENPCAETPDYRRLVLRSLPQLLKLDNVAVDEQERCAAISESTSTTCSPSSTKQSISCVLVPLTDQSTNQDSTSSAIMALDPIRVADDNSAAKLPMKSESSAAVKQCNDEHTSGGLMESVSGPAASAAGNRIYEPSKYEFGSEVGANSSAGSRRFLMVVGDSVSSGKGTVSSVTVGFVEDADSVRSDDQTSEDEDNSKDSLSEEQLSKLRFKNSGQIIEKSAVSPFADDAKRVIGGGAAESVGACGDTIGSCESSEFTWKQEAAGEGRSNQKCKILSATFESDDLPMTSGLQNQTTASNVLQAMLCLINELDETGLDIVADAVRNRRDACRGAAAREAGDVVRSGATAREEREQGALKRSDVGLDESFS